MAKITKAPFSLAPFYDYDPNESLDEKPGKVKLAFLRDAKKYLQQTASILGCEAEVSVNPGGIAGIGDGYGYFFLDGTHCLELILLQASGFLSKRKDNLALVVRKSTYRREKNVRVLEMGNNNWMDPSCNVNQLAIKLHSCFIEGKLDYTFTTTFINAKSGTGLGYGIEKGLPVSSNPPVIPAGQQLSLFEI